MRKLFITLVIASICVISISANSKIIKHKIKSGETLYSVAHKHHSTIEEVRKLNDIKNGEILKIGRIVKVKTNTYFPNKKNTKSKTKIVKKSKKVNNRLSKVLNKHSAPYYVSSRKKRRTITVDDILFKSSRGNKGQIFSTSGTKAKNIIRVAKTKLGRKYVWGAVGQRGTFDCSGFTNYVFRKNGINIPRTSINQSKYGKYVPRGSLRKGDLIFFDTSKRRKGYVNHVGIYLGNGKFIHASSAKKKVVVSSLSKFYAQRYKGARRPS